LKQVLAALAFLFCFIKPVVAQEGPAPGYVIADVVTIHSAVLGEDRKLFIYNPDNVGGNLLPAYPVLYLLEENDMPMVAGAIKYLSSYNEQLPAMLVIGIDGGGQRIRDLTPTHSLYDNTGKLDTDKDSWLAASGGTGKFRQFIQQEVIPYVESHYRAAPFRILAGHSVGGLFAVDTLAKQPDLFNAYVAVSPSIWWDRGALVPAYAGALRKPGATGKFLFVADSPETGNFTTHMRRFLDRFPPRSPDSLMWKHVFYADETHGSVAAKAYYDGLRFLYPQWNKSESDNSTALILDHYRRMSDRLGYDIQPPLGLASGWANDFLRVGKIADAIALLELNARNFPQTAWAQAELANAYARNGDKAKATAAYRRALDLNPNDKEVAQKLELLAK
jgi:predicted alpha/beta superfamily hydrolase